MSVFPLNIEEKEDHPDRIAQLEGVDSKYYESAEEINKKRAGIEENQELIQINKNSIAAIINGEGETFTTRALAMAEDPLPADGVAFVVFNEIDHNGQYRYNSAEGSGYSVIELFKTYATSGDPLENSTKFSDDGQIFDKIQAELVGVVEENSTKAAEAGDVFTKLAEITTSAEALEASIGTITDNVAPVKFDNSKRNTYGSYETPLTGMIEIDMTDAVDDGEAIVFWSGSTNPTFKGGFIHTVIGSITTQFTYTLYLTNIKGAIYVTILGVDEIGQSYLRSGYSNLVDVNDGALNLTDATPVDGESIKTLVATGLNPVNFSATSNYPVFKASQINGLGSARFIKNVTRLSADSALGLNAEVTLIIVGASSTPSMTTTNDVIVGVNTANTNNRLQINLDTDEVSDRVLGLVSTTGGTELLTTSTDRLLADEYKVFGLKYKKDDFIKGYENGTLLDTNTPLTGSDFVDEWHIGKLTAGSGFNGDFVTAIWWDRILSDVELDFYSKELMLKYNLS